RTTPFPYTTLFRSIFGAAVLGDMGEHYPSDDPRFAGADSLDLLGQAVEQAGAAGWRVEHADVTVIAEKIRVAPYREEMREQLADALGIDADRVSVKATTTDATGRASCRESVHRAAGSDGCR